jgi:hypothetical protein
VGEPTNGWRSGRDPVQRWLRVVTVLVCLAVFTYLSVVRQTVDVVPTLALALGALLLLLGYESAIRIPGLSRETRETIARPECQEPGCVRYAQSPSAFCEHHHRAVE